MGDSNTGKSKLSGSTGVKRPIGSISSCESLDLRTVSTNEAMQWVLGRVQNPKIQNALLQCLGRHPYHKDCTSLIQKIVDIGTSHLHWCEKQTRFQGYLASLLRDDIASTELVFRIATQYNVSQDDIVSLAEKSTFTSNTTSDDYLRIRREKKQKTPTPDQLYPSVKFHNLWKAGFYTEAIYFLREASYEYFKDDQIRMITKLLESYSDTRIRNIPRTLIESYLSDLLIATNSISLLSAVIISSYKSLGHPNGRYALLANTRVLILLDHCAPSEQSEALEQLRKCLLVRGHISGLKRIVDIYYPVYQEHGGTVSRNELEQYANAKLQSFHIKNEHQSMLIHEMIDHYEKYHSDMSGYVKKRSMHDIKHTYELFFNLPRKRRQVGKKAMFDALLKDLSPKQKDCSEYVTFYFWGVQNFYRNDLATYMRALRLLRQHNAELFTRAYDETIFPTLQTLIMDLPKSSHAFIRGNGAIFEAIASGEKIPVNKMSSLVVSAHQPY